MWRLWSALGSQWLTAAPATAVFDFISHGAAILQTPEDLPAPPRDLSRDQSPAPRWRQTDALSLMLPAALVLIASQVTQARMGLPHWLRFIWKDEASLFPHVDLSPFSCGIRMCAKLLFTNRTSSLQSELGFCPGWLTNIFPSSHSVQWDGSRSLVGGASGKAIVFLIKMEETQQLLPFSFPPDWKEDTMHRHRIAILCPFWQR